MRQLRITAVFMRGGTSKAIVFRESDLPRDRAARDMIFLDAIGSPDPNGRQLDGMGGGVSSLSKVCIVGPPTRGDADVDYTFAQVSVTDAVVDYGSNCGNMSSAIGPFAVDEGLVAPVPDGEAVVRIHNINTGKIIHASFNVAGGEAVVDGSLALDGVSGAGAPVRLDFLAPGGSQTGKLLPAGSATCILLAEGMAPVEASLVDADNPCVFVAAIDLGKTATEMPGALEADAELLQRLEAIRRAASVAMGLAGDLRAAAGIVSVPKIAMVAAPQACRTLSGRALSADEIDLLIRMISVGSRTGPCRSPGCSASPSPAGFRDRSPLGLRVPEAARSGSGMHPASPSWTPMSKPLPGVQSRVRPPCSAPHDACLKATSASGHGP